MTDYKHDLDYIRKTLELYMGDDLKEDSNLSRPVKEALKDIEEALEKTYVATYKFGGKLLNKRDYEKHLRELDSIVPTTIDNLNKKELEKMISIEQEALNDIIKDFNEFNKANDIMFIPPRSEFEILQNALYKLERYESKWEIPSFMNKVHRPKKLDIQPTTIDDLFVDMGIDDEPINEKLERVKI